MAELQRKKAEVRARMEEASKAKKAKKGFMTPERKKKLRVGFSLKKKGSNRIFMIFIIVVVEKEGRRGAEKGAGTESSRTQTHH